MDEAVERIVSRSLWSSVYLLSPCAFSLFDIYTKLDSDHIIRVPYTDFICLQ